MSNRKYPYNYNHVHIPKQGVLSDWEKITTNDADGNIPVGDHAFTIADLMSMLKTFKDEFNPIYIAKVAELIERHVVRTDNPHLTSLDDLNTSVMQELYLAWIDAGYVGTREEFLKVIFQYVQIADIPETLKGEAHNKIITPAGLKAVVDRHDDDPWAHDDLMARLMPGSPIRCIPTMSILPVLGLPLDVIVKRDTPMWIISNTGMVRTIPEDTLEADYSTGEPAFPIFGELTNELLDSINFNNDKWWGVENAYIDETLTIDNIQHPELPSYVLREKYTDIPKIHSAVYLRENIGVQQGDDYTITAIVSPMERHCIGIEILDDANYDGSFGCAIDNYTAKDSTGATDDVTYANVNVTGLEQSGFLPFDQGPFYSHTYNPNSQRFAQFDLKELKTFTSSEQKDIFAYIYPLHNGSYRIQCTFKAKVSIALKIKFYLLDIYDGDRTYEGIEGHGMVIFGSTITKGTFLPPYLISEQGVCGHIDKTSVQIPIDDTWFRNEEGTIVMRTSNNSVNRRLMDISELYNIGNSNTSVSLFARHPVGHADRIYMAGYADNNDFLASHWTVPCTDPWISFMHGYNNKLHMYGGPCADVSTIDVDYHINSDAKYVYLGCDRYLNSQLNGFVSSFIYYPELLDPDNLEFFTLKFEDEV